MDQDLLLCELHAHTTWSDGVLTVTELVETLLPCRKSETAVVEHLRSDRRAYVVPWGLRDELRKPLAA